MRNARAGVLRSVTLFALWVVAATGATLVGLTAVGAIGTGIVNPGPPPLTPTEIGNRLAAPAQTPTTDAQAPATTAVQPSPGEVLVLGAGGTVVATCAGATVRLLAVSPAQGFQETDHLDDDGDHKVEFRSARLEVKAKLHCFDGRPVADVKTDEA
jgi:hypothetical protein